MATVVAVEGCADVFVSAFPCGAGVPTTAVVNAPVRAIVANGALVRLSAEGSLCVYANAPVDVVVDVTAWVGSGGATPRLLPPDRLVDTRRGFSQRLALPQRRLAAGEVLDVPVSAVPALAAADAVAINLAAVDPATDGFLTVYPGPCSAGRPLAASLNVMRGDTIAAGTTSAVGAGSICIFTSTPTDVVVDVNAAYDGGGGGPALVPSAPRRLLDTRDTVPVRAGGVVSLDLDDPEVGAPANATGFVANLATTGPAGAGLPHRVPVRGRAPERVEPQHGRGADHREHRRRQRRR